MILCLIACFIHHRRLIRFFIDLFYVFRDNVYGLLRSIWHPVAAGGGVRNNSSGISTIENTTENNTDPQSNIYRF